MWDAEAIVQTAAGAIRDAEERRRAEQAVYGLDSLEEVDLHPLLAEAFMAAGHGVLREQPYPGEWRARKGRRKTLPEQSERKRCDLVLLPGSGMAIADRLVEAREEETDMRLASGTLFAEHRAAVTRVAEPDPAAITPSEAYWLEVKVVGQFCFTCGVPGPNSKYGSELVRSTSTDLRKLRDDPVIEHAGVLLVHFVEGIEVASHDLLAVVHKCLDKGLMLRSPRTEGVPIADRIGNRLASLTLIEPMRGEE